MAGEVLRQRRLLPLYVRESPPPGRAAPPGPPAHTGQQCGVAARAADKAAQRSGTTTFLISYLFLWYLMRAPPHISVADRNRGLIATLGLILLLTYKLGEDRLGTRGKACEMHAQLVFFLRM